MNEIHPFGKKFEEFFLISNKSPNVVKARGARKKSMKRIH
jgi:hypothetical protein